MSNLKTLKDIEDDWKLDSNMGYWVDDLRSAAREWINLLEKDLAKLDDVDSVYDDIMAIRRDEINAKLEWIRMFFNLEDEE